MKKLMIMVSALCIALSMQAASWNWKITGSIYTPGNATTTLASGTAYLFDAATTSQAALLALFQGGTTDISGKAVTGAATIAITAGANSGVTANFDYATAGDYNYYAAIVSGNYVYITASKAATGLDVGTTTIGISGVSTSSKSTFDSSVTTYSSAGWYTAAPEPASIGLLLLGLCAMGLKRKVS